MRASGGVDERENFLKDERETSSDSYRNKLSRRRRRYQIHTIFLCVYFQKKKSRPLHELTGLSASFVPFYITHGLKSSRTTRSVWSSTLEAFQDRMSSSCCGERVTMRVFFTTDTDWKHALRLPTEETIAEEICAHKCCRAVMKGHVWS